MQPKFFAKSCRMCLYVLHLGASEKSAFRILAKLKNDVSMENREGALVILLTGGIGSGKSAVRRILEGMGVPCYDADSAVKGFYAAPGDDGEYGPGQGSEVLGVARDGRFDKTEKPFLLPEIEAALGQKFRRTDGSFNSRALAAVIFSDAAKLKTVEDIVFPALVADFGRWRKSSDMASVPNKSLPADVIVFESATALDKPDFPKIWDKCLWVDAPEELRIERVMARDHCSREQVLSRLRLQSPLAAHRNEIDAVILNDCSLSELSSRVRSALNCIMRPENRYR